MEFRRLGEFARCATKREALGNYTFQGFGDPYQGGWNPEIPDGDCGLRRYGRCNAP